MQYNITCPLGTDERDEARALYQRLANMMLERFDEVLCKIELREEEQDFRPAGMPAGMSNVKREYFARFKLDTADSAAAGQAIVDLAEDFGLDRVDWVEDGRGFCTMALRAEEVAA